jgi:glycosyltransferase involved in cell wall biosynthesis
MKLALLTTDNREDTRNYSAPAPYFGTAPDALLKGFAAIPGLEVHVISCARERMQSPEKLAPNIFFHSLHVPKAGWMRTGYLGCVRAVRKKLRELRPDIVHGQGTERDCGISAALCGRPAVLTIHGNMRQIAKVCHAPPFSFMWLAAQLEGLAISRVKGVICITHHTEHAVIRSAKHTWLVPNAVDPSFFELQAVPDECKGPILLCVGDIYRLKNQNALIRALEPLVQKHKFTVQFLGRVNADEPYGAEFLDLVKARPWCDYRGFANRETLKSLLVRASLLVLPSLEENCPMAILEAVAAGVPVAASRAGGIPDLIHHGKTGWLFEPLDPPTIQTTIDIALTGLSRTREMAAEGKARGRELFHPDVVARRHLEIYQGLLGRG